VCACAKLCCPQSRSIVIRIKYLEIACFIVMNSPKINFLEKGFTGLFRRFDINDISKEVLAFFL